MAFYLERASWAVSIQAIQAIQDDSGEKSTNWLAGWLADFVYVVSTSLSILFSLHQFEESRLSLRRCIAWQNWKNSSKLSCLLFEKRTS